MKKVFFKNGLIDLAQARLGTKVVYKTDEFFASAKRIINPWPPIFKEGVFDKNGKWMDGWETRRKRNKGNDFFINPGFPNFIISQSKFFPLLLLVSHPSPIFFPIPGASIFSALPKCSLLHAIGTAPFNTEVRFIIFLPNFFLISIEP